MTSLIQACAGLLLGTSMCLAQETPTNADNNKTLTGFEWLKQFEGTWATDFNGTMESRVVGKLWIVNEYNFQTGLSAVQLIGYDARKRQFTGSWVDFSSTFQWHYTGSLDAAGKILTLEAEGPDLTDPTKSRRYRDSYEFKSENEIAATSEMLNDQGEWKTFNTGKMTKSAQPETENEAQTSVTPFLMFDGRAEAAINFYKSVFPGTQVESLTKYQAGENGKEGTVKLAAIVIAGQSIKCIDSPVKHDFELTPAFSFFVECENETQLKERFEKLSEGGNVMMPLGNYGFSQQFGWATDQFGANWQLNLK